MEFGIRRIFHDICILFHQLIFRGGWVLILLSIGIPFFNLILKFEGLLKFYSLSSILYKGLIDFSSSELLQFESD